MVVLLADVLDEVVGDRVEVTDQPADSERVGTYFRGNLSNMPSRWDASFLADQGGTFIVDSESSAPISSWDVEWLTQDRILRGSGSLPSRLHADNLGPLKFDSFGEATDITLSIAPPGGEVIPTGVEGDYAVARLAWGEARVAVRLTGLLEASIDSALGSYLIERDDTQDTYVDLALEDHSRLLGTVTAMAGRVWIGLDQDLAGDNVTWLASGTTGGIDLEGWKDGRVWKFVGTDLPASFDARIQVAEERFELTTPGAFGSIELAFAEAFPYDLPRIAGPQGFVVDLSNGPDAQKGRIALKLANLQSIILANGVTLDIDLQRSSAGGSLAGVYRTVEGGADVYMESLTGNLSLSVSQDSTRGGVQARIDAGTEALGSVLLNYTGRFGDVRAFLGNLSNYVDLSLERGSGTRLTYEAGTVSGGTMTLHGHILTNDGYWGNFSLTQLPREFTLIADTLNKTAFLDAKVGAFSGTLYAGKVGGLVQQPPQPSDHGASVSVDPDNLHLWLRVSQPTNVSYTSSVVGTDIIRVAHSGALTGRFYVHGEDEQRKGNVTLVGVPSDITVNLRRSVGNTTFLYEATGTMSQVYVEAETKGERADKLWARLWNAPSKASVHVHNRTDNYVDAKVEHQGDATPHMAMALDTADRVYARATLFDVPSSVHLTIDPTVSETRPGCVADFDTDGVITYANLSFGKGSGPTRDPWTDQAAQYLRIDMSGSLPAVSLRLDHLGDASFCRPAAEDFTVSARVGLIGHMRTFYQSETWERLHVDIRGSTNGTLSFEKVGGLIRYNNTGGSVSALAVDSTIRFTEPLFNRTVRRLNVTGTTIPSGIMMASEGSNTTLLSSDVVGDLSVALDLIAPSSSGSGGGGPSASSPKDFRVDVNGFDADHVKFVIAPGTQITWPQETHKVIFDATRTQLGLELYGLQDGLVAFDAEKSVEVEDFRVLSGTGLNVTIVLPPDAPIPAMAFVIHCMPNELDLIYTFPVGLDLTPGSPICSAVVSLGPSPNTGTLIRLTHIPAGKVTMGDTISAWVATGAEDAAIATGTAITNFFLDSGPLNLGGLLYHMARSSTHQKTYYLEQTHGKLEIQADVDRAQNFPNSPQYVWMSGYSGNNLDIHHLHGEHGVRIRGDAMGVDIDNGAFLTGLAVDGGVEKAKGIKDMTTQKSLQWAWTVLFRGKSYDFSSLMPATA